MKIKAIRLKNNTDIIGNKEREVKGMIIILALFAAGVIVGSGIFRNGNSELSNELAQVFDTFVTARENQKLYVTFFNSAIINTVFLIIPFIFGLSCVGLPVTAIVAVTKGLGLGIVAGYMFSNFAMSGIGYYLLTIFPGAIIANSILLLGCNCSLFMSTDILSVILSKKQPDANMLSTYLKKYLILLIGSFAASAIDGILTKAFSYLFSF